MTAPPPLTIAHPAPGATRPPRDPALVAETRALVAAMARYPTLKALRATAEGLALEARAEALLAGVRRYVPRTEPAAVRDSAPLRVIQWNVEHGNWYAFRFTEVGQVVRRLRST